MDLAIVRFQLLCELTCALELIFISSLEKICLLSPLINKLKYFGGRKNKQNYRTGTEEVPMVCSVLLTC